MDNQTIRIVGDQPVEFYDCGEGRPVLLLHSSASGAHQWRSLTDQISASRRVIAPNLLGYGATCARTVEERRTISGQVDAVLSVLDDVNEQIDLVGHSFGAVIALELAARLGPKARRVAVFEPNAFALLKQTDYQSEWDTVRQLHQQVQFLAERGAWRMLAARFADFFSGDGVWAAMPDKRREILAEALRTNPEEWDVVMAPDITPERWQVATTPVMVSWARDTRQPLRAVAEILLRSLPNTTACEVPRGGHLAPISRPRSFNGPVMDFLNS